jgi:hypothetical protein
MSVGARGHAQAWNRNENGGRASEQATERAAHLLDALVHRRLEAAVVCGPQRLPLLLGSVGELIIPAMLAPRLPTPL